MSLRTVKPACMIGFLLAASLAAQDQPKVPEPAEPTTRTPPPTAGGVSASQMTATEPAMSGQPNPSRTIGGESARAPAGPRTSVAGEVVRYEPGRSVVLRGADGVDRTFALPSNLNVPPDVAIGSRLTLVTEAASGGSIQVREVRSGLAPAAAGAKPAEAPATSSGPPARQTPAGVSTRRAGSAVTLYRVSSYEPGKSIKLSRPEGFEVTLRIDKRSKVPADLAVGRTVSVETRTVSKRLTVRSLRIEAE